MVDFDDTKKSKVKFGDDKTMPTQGVGNVMTQRRDGRYAVISDVLYVSRMSNLLSIGQLLEKGFIMNMKHDHMEVLDSNVRSNHIETKHHFFHDQVNKGRLELCFASLNCKWLIFSLSL